MSSLALLVTELQSLASETKRRHPEIREAAERSLALLRSSPEQAIANLQTDDAKSHELLRPVFMGCGSKNAKIIGISLSSLQRLIALHAVPQSSVPGIIDLMNDCMSQGVDIQLRILQTLLSLITNIPNIHGDNLGDALILCFKLQESRIAVVSSTAAATLRQLVMFVVDKVVAEDRSEETDALSLTDTVLPDNSTKALGPSSRDAFSILEDLCLLANAEKPRFLKLESLPKTFALELIESVLTNYHDLFRQHSELLLILNHHLCPLLLKTLSERPVFPLTLRSTRVVFLLLKQFSRELTSEVEVFLTLLIKVIGGEIDTSTGTYASETGHGHAARPTWMRVLAMEIVRGLCSDAELVRFVWDQYDAQGSGSKLYGSLITTLSRLVMEKPGVLGVSTQLFGIGVPANAVDMVSPTSGSSSSGIGFDVASVAGLVANAASATVTGVVGMMGSEPSLSLATSAMRLQCIDQLDKADTPPIPESYLYLLALQSLVSLCEGFAALTLPLYNTLVVQRPRAAGDAVIRAPPALDIGSLSLDELSTKQLKTVHDMIEDGWPGVLAALSFLMATNLSDELFAEVLQSYQNMANVSGMLGLATPRDAFLTSLAKFAIPSRVVSSIESYVEPPTPRSTGVLPENLSFSALSTNTTQAPGLSERNMACLKVFISSALFLAGGLGPSWYTVMEALQNADYVLTKTGKQNVPTRQPSGGPPAASRHVSASGPGGPQTGSAPVNKHPMLADTDSDTLLRSIQRIFDSSKNLEDSAFKNFIAALCQLSQEMINMQSNAAAFSSPEIDKSDGSRPPKLSPTNELTHRRRVSGIHLPKSTRSGDFGINKLGSVARQNIHRLLYRSPDIAWDTITRHLLTILRNPIAPHTVRLQAAKTLDDILIVIPRNLGSTGEMQGPIQERMLAVLSQQVAPDPMSGNTITVVEIRKMGLETLHQILQSSGHTLTTGWEIIFDMLGSVCDPLPSAGDLASVTSVSSSSVGSSGGRPTSLGYGTDRGTATLVRIGFQSLTLVCESISVLSPDHLRLCISTLGRYGRQTDTNIALTAAGSLLWGVSDSLQAKRKDPALEAQYSTLWMFLLLEVLGLCTDPRPEVRVGAIQTLFRTLQLYGATLSDETWDECLWKVTLPLLDSITNIMQNLPDVNVPLSPNTASAVQDPSKPSYPWDESKSLALQSIGNILGDFLTTKLLHLESFDKFWDQFIQHVQMSFIGDRPSVSTAALRCLDRALRALGDVPEQLQSRLAATWSRVWVTCEEMGKPVRRVDVPRSADSDDKTQSFDQESLAVFVEVIQSVRSVSQKLEKTEWPLERLTSLLGILKGIITYPLSSSYRPDIDGLSPVQALVVDTVKGIDFTIPGCPSLVLRDLSEFVTLPFIASFDVQEPSSNAKTRSTNTRVTYIALAKVVMPMLVDLFIRFKDETAIYADGTLESIFSAYGIPIKLKYECPAPSKFGNDPPLWKTAVVSFLRIVQEAASQIMRLDGIPDDRVEAIWRQILETFRGGILADCTFAESFSLEEQEAEEDFDLFMIATLEIDVIPFLGDSRIPDFLPIQLAKILNQGSRLLNLDVDERDFPNVHIKSPSVKSSKEEKPVSDVPSTANGTVISRERFAYWCFDLLFLMCSATAQDHVEARQRVATLCLPTLLQRCQSTLDKCLADDSLRGHCPFPRAREEELIYVLRHLLDLRLWPGIFRTALKATAETPSAIQEAVKDSSVAHLFYFYRIFCQFASMNGSPICAWTPHASSETKEKPRVPGGVDLRTERSRVATSALSGESSEYDARILAASALKEIGVALGVEEA